LTKPTKCSFELFFLTCSQACKNIGFLKKLLSSIDKVMRERSCPTIRPAPIFKWPTSELPISPQGNPTEGPDACRVVAGYLLTSWLKVSGCASVMALPCDGEAMPKPSKTTSTNFLYGLNSMLFQFLFNFHEAVVFHD